MSERSKLASIDFWDGNADWSDVPADEARVIAGLESLFAATLPNEAYRRSLDELRKALDSHPDIAGAAAVPMADGSGSFTQKHRLSAPEFRSQRRLVLAAIAAALLLLLGGAVVYWSGAKLPGRGDQGGVIPAAPGLDESGWPVYRGNSSRDGVTDEDGPTAEPTQLWSVRVGGSTKQSPAVSSGIVYIGSSNHKLFALDAGTGEQIWEYEGDSSLEMTPAVANGLVYVPSANGTLVALDAQSGGLRWTFAHPLGAYATPAVDGDALFAGSMDGVLYAIDGITGEVRWSFETGEPFQRPAAVLDGVVYAGNDDGFVYALDARDGSVIWSFDTRQTPVGMPTVTEHSVYVSQIGGGIFVLDRANGTLTMTLQNPGRSGLSSPAANGRIVAVGGGIDDPEMHVFDAETGEPLFSFGLTYGGPWLSAPVLTDDRIYAFSNNRGVVMAANATTGEEIWSYRVKLRNSGGAVDSGPVIADGVLYISTDLGVIYALR